VSIRGDHEALIAAAYSAGALHDPVIIEVDGDLVIRWPEGRGLCVMSPDVLEEFVARLNGLRRSLAQSREVKTQ